jgi:uncharacterized protein YkwD
MTAALTFLGGGLVAGRCDPPPPAPAPEPAPAPAAAPAPAPAPADTGVGAEVAALANSARASAGLAPLATDGRLVTAAANHSSDQAASGRMSHTGSNGSSPGDRVAAAGFPAGTWAENVAAGQPSAQAVFDAWMASPGHRANILHGGLTHIGVAMATSADGTPYWTMTLATAA